MICPNCQYDKWDGKSTHLYAGRASAGLNCFGPKPGTVAYRAVQPVKRPEHLPPPKPEEVRSSDPEIVKPVERVEKPIPDALRGKVVRASTLPPPNPDTKRELRNLARLMKKARRSRDPGRTRSGLQTDQSRQRQRPSRSTEGRSGHTQSHASDGTGRKAGTGIDARNPRAGKPAKRGRGQ